MPSQSKLKSPQVIQTIPYSKLSDADLVVDAVYESKPGTTMEGEALSTLLTGVGNQGGFRAAGKGDDKKLVLLYTSTEDIDWPDSLDPTTGRFLYFGDNKRPGNELHSTPRQGNRILRNVFNLLHRNPPLRSSIPPFLVFQKFPTPSGSRSFQFKGLAVPGFNGLPPTDDLVAVWKVSKGHRFQNYRAVFTILDVPTVHRAWINDLLCGKTHSQHEPLVWREWIEKGTYSPLTAESTSIIRTRDEQVPNTPLKVSILNVVWNHFDGHASTFESFAARLFQWHEPRATIDAITRSSVDGGRDAVGRYLIGIADDPIYAKFSLEAKCYCPPLNDKSGTSVGVNEVARLISRIRFRQFGVLVTTSVIGVRAYSEVREDGHPIVFICGKDIADILVDCGFNTPSLVQSMLTNEFPTAQDSVTQGGGVDARP